MDITIHPRKLSGVISAIPSKSQAHRLLLCAAFSNKQTIIQCEQTNQDIEATAECLRSLGAGIERTASGYQVMPITNYPECATLNCHESGSTLRFLLPIVGAMGIHAEFLMEGRLPQRPLSPLWEEMERMGCSLTRTEHHSVLCSGKLRQGDYALDGSVSSQFITGLLFALSLLPGTSTLKLLGKIESQPYINMTLDALSRFHIDIPYKSGAYILSRSEFISPGNVVVEGDWSNGAFWLAAQYLGSELDIQNLNDDSVQGDRKIAECLKTLHSKPEIDASDIPDLVPILAVVAGACNGAAFTHAQRLRIKESDRIQTVADLINGLGGSAGITEDGLDIEGTGYAGGTINSAGDHRIAMAAAIAATVCTQPVVIQNAEAVKKSYPGFWDDYKKLGGII